MPALPAALPRPPRRLGRRARLVWLALGACLGNLPAFAQVPAATPVDGGLAEQVMRTARDFLQGQLTGLPGQASFTLTPLDGRTSLTPCPALEAFLPPGSRAWGRTTVGVRCLAPGGWTLYLSAQVQVQGSYLVSTRPLAFGQQISAADVQLKQGDLAALPQGVLTDPAAAIGKGLTAAVGAGLPLRREMLRAPLVVRQGEQVRIVVEGPGFTVGSEGRALANATEGQVVRVHTSTGRTVSGVARADGVVVVSH